MDVAVFRTLKSGWKEQVSAWRLQNQHEPLRRRDFAPLLDAAIKDRKMMIDLIHLNNLKTSCKRIT
ncbi:hypothetical protein PPYR_01717 [Photinus pyralis]|uniref:Uncharacterized protein n=1 Tax=Photinus pyralis TaxID=7054 RepID=A0A5N4B557_PHOPY|nr:hypothetical protein PPYR_01717 [Photinus pyralis]